MVDLSRLMQNAAILEVIDKSADEASSLSAQNSYQAMRIEELEQQLAVTTRERNDALRACIADSGARSRAERAEQQLAERDAELAALKGHA